MAENLLRAAMLVVAAALVAECGASSSAPAPAAPEKPAPPDPMKDPAAWKGLAETERTALVYQVIAKTDFGAPSSVAHAVQFFRERGDAKALELLARRTLEKDASAQWAHAAVGDVDVKPRVEQCLKECEVADSENVAPIAEIKKLVGPLVGPRWMDAATAKRVDDLIVAAHVEDKRLSDPYEGALAKWIHWQSGYEGMSDSPEIHEATGQYIVFVTMNGSKGRDVAGVAPADLLNAKGMLERRVKLLTSLHDAWMQEFAQPFHCVEYGPKNCDQRTLLKVNLFTDPAHYMRFQFSTTYSWEAGANSATYVSGEPRFLAAYEYPGYREWSETAFVVEAVKQLVHFHTWDVTRRTQGHELDWSQCLSRPLWSAEGFARFFASRADMGGSWRYMHVDEAALSDVFACGAVAAERKWKPWTLAEILAFSTPEEVRAAARHRADAADADGAVDPLDRLFHARAWSLIWFLWNAQDGANPKYRARFLDYLASEYRVKTKRDREGHEAAIRPTPADFRAAMGLVAAPAFAAFETEWNAFEKRVLDAHRRPEWETRKKQILEALASSKKK